MKKHEIADLKEILNIQLSNGNWNYDPYMHGMTNGMILFISLLEGIEPEFKEAPNEWLSQSKEEKGYVLQ